MFRSLALFCMMLPLLAACAQAFGPEAESGPLRGETSLTYIFKDDTQRLPRTRINGAQLKEGGHYRGRGLLVIEGDVPPHSSVTVTDGKLVVTGHVARNTRITVMQDVVSFNEQRDVACTPPEAGECHATVKAMRRKFSDGDPAVDIKGDLGTDAKIITNGAVLVSGRPFAHDGFIPTMP